MTEKPFIFMVKDGINEARGSELLVATRPSNQNPNVGGSRVADSHDICNVLDCDKPRRARGMCWKHYCRQRRIGLGPKPARKILKNNGKAARFIRSVVANPTDACILWPFQVTKAGYGRCYYDGRHWRAHRLALFLHLGPPPTEEHYAAHKPVVCHNRSCVNPRHLRWATPTENANDRVDDNTNQNCGVAKLTADQVCEIRERYEAGESQTSLAEDYGVTQPNISAIILGKTWRGALLQ